MKQINLHTNLTQEIKVSIGRADATLEGLTESGWKTDVALRLRYNYIMPSS